MKKIKVSADAVLSIIQGIMNDPAINYQINDISAPSDWQGKKVQEVLGVEYYTFRHRPVDTEIIIGELIKQGLPFNDFQSLTRSFCILSLGHIERVFSKNNDIVTIPVNLEYWIQTEKVKLLEDMFEDISVETIGERIPVQIGTEERQMVMALGSLDVSEIQEITEYGEMSVCEIDIDIIIHPNVSTMSDYKIEFFVDGGWVQLPVLSISTSNNMTQKSVPKANNVRNVGSINLSKVRSFVLSFDGYRNIFIDGLVEESLDDGRRNNKIDNNKSIIMRLTRHGKDFIHECIIKDHTIIIQEDTGNETHALTLTKRGTKNGTSQS